MPLGRLIHQGACPLGQKLDCVAGNELGEVIEAKSPPVSLARPNITDCLVHDVRLSVREHVGVVEGVASAPSCHAHCLQAARQGCTHWTWRGDTQQKKCFLLPAEGRLVRSQGASAGTTRPDMGCQHTIIQQVTCFYIDFCLKHAFLFED